MVSCRFGGIDGLQVDLEDRGDLVVVRTNQRGPRPEESPLAGRSLSAMDQLAPLFHFPASGVGVYESPPGSAAELCDTLTADPEVEFAGRGLRDRYGEPVVYTENTFVKFVDDASARHCEQVVRSVGFRVKRRLRYSRNAYFLSAEQGVGREVFDRAEELLGRDDVELCHPELVRERAYRRAFARQWHLRATSVGGTRINAHANVTAAWKLSRGKGIVICVIDDGVDIDHEEFSSTGKIVAPQSFTKPRSDDPRPGAGENHGTAASGVACADGRFGASGVAPDARLMPLRNVSGLGSQDEADAFAWAATHGADVISCSWGPRCGPWWIPEHPLHEQVVPLPDNTRLAIEFAVTKGRGQRGCVIVWAAGNGNESVDNDGYANNPNVIAVAACNDSGTKSAYSDYGKAIWCAFPSDDRATEAGPAPRTPGIWTTDRTGRTGYNPGNTTRGDQAGNYTNSFGGTSSACPGVAGVAALVLAQNPQLDWNEVKDILERSADQIDATPGQYDSKGHSTRYGFGRVNAAAAVRLASP